MFHCLIAQAHAFLISQMVLTIAAFDYTRDGRFGSCSQQLQPYFYLHVSHMCQLLAYMAFVTCKATKRIHK